MRIGIDIGGMSIKIGLVDENKNIVAKEVIPTQSDTLSAEHIAMLKDAAMQAFKK